MNCKTMQAQEELLAAAHRVMSLRIDDRPQGPHDDAEAEYAEGGLAVAAAGYARARLLERLAKAHGNGGPRSVLEERIELHASRIGDAGFAGWLSSWFKADAAEAAVMELALLEVIQGIGEGTLHLDEVREIAIEALPEEAGKSA